MKKLGIFCGSSTGASSKYEEAAISIGKILVQNKINLVYGGADIGLMKVLAEVVLSLGGHVIGVLPKFLIEREIAHWGLTELIMVESMYERKKKIAELSDGFITLPGGFGTLDESFEMLTWNQLRLQSKPFGLLNIDGFFDKLLEFLDRMVEDHFLKPVHREMIIVSDNPGDLIEKMKDARLTSESKTME
ncbi:MAG: TIGR00730 family Rossman fold protein [Bacteroidales bacterium]|nr:MAG: TIGR00730 family Rossman fold protein [Bacteroidales bacterium]